MKRIILALTALVLSVSMLSAQDLQSATDTYNNGAAALSSGDKAAALTNFQSALKMAEALGADGADLLANCKAAIPAVILSIGKELYNNKNFDDALAKIQEAAKVAQEYGVEDVAKEALELVPQIALTKDMDAANDAFAAKDMAAAAEGYKKVLAADSTNAAASLRLIQCLANVDDLDGAKKILPLAKNNGQGENAAKVIGTTYLKKAAAALKANKLADAVEFAEQVNEFTENPQAFLVAGQASQKLNKGAQAIKNFEKYLEAAPTASNANAIAFTVAALYQQAGNKAKAKEFYQKVVSDPKFGASAKQQIDALSK